LRLDADARVQREARRARNPLPLLLTELRGHRLEGERLLSGTRSHRHTVRDRVTDEIVHRSAARGIEREVARLAVALEPPPALERSADPFGDPREQHSELVRARRADAPKHRRARVEEIGAVEEQRVAVQVQVQRRAEPLNQLLRP
jgi:hypothetical protein